MFISSKMFRLLTIRLKQFCAFACAQVSTDEATDLEHRLDLLKRTHAELTLSLNGIKKKIELAKDGQS